MRCPPLPSRPSAFKKFSKSTFASKLPAGGPGSSMATRRKLLVAVAASTLALGIALLVTPLIGSAHVDYAKAWAGLSPDKEILFYARVPRVLLASLAGGALATAGVLFQALLRESLADPYTLGLSSGASLGAVLAICLGWQG